MQQELANLRNEMHQLHEVQIEVTGESDSALIVEYRTCDGTATAPENFDQLIDGFVCYPSQTAFPAQFTVRINRLSAEQRAAGGATFTIKLDTVVGAVAEVKEKTITIVPAKR